MKPAKVKYWLEEQPPARVQIVLLAKAKEKKWPRKVASIALVLWDCLWVRPGLVRHQGGGLRALEEHEWRPISQARNWNDL